RDKLVTGVKTCALPISVCEVPRGAKNPEGVKRNRPGMLKFSLHFAEGRAGICQDMHAAEAQMPGVPDHVEEGDGAGPALRSEHRSEERRVGKECRTKRA